MAKNSFILFHDQKEIIDELSDEQAGKLLKAFYEYNVNHKCKLTGALKLVFIPFKTAFERNTTKWEAVAESRSQAGKKHTGNQYTRAKENGTNGTSVPKLEQMEQNGTNGTVSVSVSGSVSDSVSVSESVSVNNIIPPTSPTEIFSYCSSVFQGYREDDMKRSCTKMFNHYSSKNWKDIYNWQRKADEWIQDDINSGVIKESKRYF